MLIISLLGALLPTIFFVWMIWWADRYEREPTRLLAMAFLWGALPSILLALAAELLLSLPLDPSALWGEWASMAFIAPVVEESVKGLALLGLMWRMRSEIDDVLDGVVYGALVGAGFAMTENFFYFLGQETLGDLQLLIFLRAGVFGLNHIFYTAVFGVSVGAAAQMSRKFDQIITLLLGMSGAILLHMMHNTGAVMSQVSPIFIIGSTFALWSGLATFLLLILILLARERRIIRIYLDEHEPRALPPLERQQLMAVFPPPERFLPNRFLPAQARRRARIYQTVAELAFHWQRLSRAKGARVEAISQEMAALQCDLEALTSSESANV